MIEIRQRMVYGYIEKVYEWTTKSFNARTGNKCTSFRPNRHTAPESR